MFYQNRQDYLFVKMTYNNSFLAHIHCQAEIFYVLDGAVEVTIANQTQLLKKGMLSIAFPNVVHKTYTPEHSSAILIIVHPNFLPDFSYELCKHLPQQPFISHIHNSDQFSKLMYHLLENTEKNTDIRVSKGYLYLILSAIISEIKLVRQETIPSDICQDIINYLNQHSTSVTSRQCSRIQQIPYLTYLQKQIWLLLQYLSQAASLRVCDGPAYSFRHDCHGDLFFQWF